MSNEVYGYIVSMEVSDWITCFLSIQEKTGIGIKAISKSELHNFPEDILPNKASSYVAFIVGDKPGKTNTTYLTDYQDYSPEADIGFPTDGKERLNLLVDMFIVAITCAKATRFVVAITDSSQVDEVKKVRMEELPTVIARDFEEFAPPDCIYDVSI